VKVRYASSVAIAFLKEEKTKITDANERIEIAIGAKVDNETKKPVQYSFCSSTLLKIACIVPNKRLIATLIAPNMQMSLIFLKKECLNIFRNI
jgi:hypothetical protein